MSDSLASSERRGSKDPPPRISEQTAPTAEDHDSTLKEALKSQIRTHLSTHDSLMRQTQWGFTATGGRKRRDLLTDLSERLLSHSSKQSLLEHEIAMQKSLREFSGILEEIEEVSKVAKDYPKKGNRYHIAGTAVLGAAAFGLIAALFTAGGSMAVAAVATGAAGAFLIKIAWDYKDKIKTTAEKIEKSVKEFLETLQELKENLVEIKSLSEKLQESTVQRLAALILKKVEEVQKVLEQLSELGKILKLLQGEGFVDSVRQLYSQNEQVLTKLEELRTAVEAFRDQSMSS